MPRYTSIFLICFCAWLSISCEQNVRLNIEQQASLQRLRQRCYATEPLIVGFKFLETALDTTFGDGLGSSRVHCVLFSPHSTRFGALVSYRTQKGSYSGNLVLGYVDTLSGYWRSYIYPNMLPYGGVDHEQMRESLLLAFGIGLKDQISIRINDDSGRGRTFAMSRANLGDDTFWSDVPWQRDTRIEGLYLFEARENVTNREPFWLRLMPIAVYPVDSLAHELARLEDSG